MLALARASHGVDDGIGAAYVQERLVHAREGRSLGVLRRARRSNLDGSIGPLAEVRIRGEYRVIADLGKWHRLDHRRQVGLEASSIRPSRLRLGLTRFR